VRLVPPILGPLTETDTQLSSPQTSNRSPIPVLLYHAVPRAHDAGDLLSVDRNAFATHLDAIVASGRTPMTIGEIAAALRGEEPLPQRPMGITFDDADEGTLEALELLCSRDLRATVYVITGELGNGSGFKQDQLRALAARANQIQLGAHSVTHPRLDELARSEVEREVRESKARLEEESGCTIDTFAYPYGAYDRRVREIVVDAGFESAAAVKNAVSHSEDDPWALARWTVGNATSPTEIAEVLDGRRAPLAWQHERLRTRGYRILRRLRRKISSPS
jgi:peptidoglycan/xylan/chitin deacetylase (PgdA/CDA1 family)